MHKHDWLLTFQDLIFFLMFEKTLEKKHLGGIFLSVPSRDCSSCFSNDGTELSITD